MLDLVLFPGYVQCVPNTFGPDVSASTLHAPAPEGAMVVAGMGTEPRDALRELRKVAQIEARSADREAGRDETDGRWEIVGVTLTPGPIPDYDAREQARRQHDNDSGGRNAVRPGWVSIGTLIRHDAAAEAGSVMHRVG